MEFTLLGAAILAYLAMSLTAKRLQSDHKIKLADTVLGASMAGLLVGRVTYMLGTGTNPITHLGDFILIRAGVSTLGAAIGFVAVLLWQAKNKTPMLMALIAVPSLVGLAFWEMGCLVRGTCLGTEAGFGLASASGVIRHPIGIYTGVALLLGAAAIYRAQRSEIHPWTGPAAFALAALARAVTEPLRLHFGAGLLWWYIGGITLGLVGVWLSRTQEFSPIHSKPNHESG